MALQRGHRQKNSSNFIKLLKKDPALALLSNDSIKMYQV